ncbi:MAG: hypothetical protein SF162_09540 [bacterium]|nr:hypothetical protein [bacterium]
MSKRAYVDVNADGYWALFEGDGSEDEPILLAVGDVFEPGAPIREVMEGLESWAAANDYVIVPPAYSKRADLDLDDLLSE